MEKMFNNGLKILLLCFLFLSCNKEENTKTYEEVVLVANRAGSSITFIDAISNATIKTLSISGSEPMYVVYVPTKDKIYVGDRANKKVYIVNPTSKEVESSIEVGSGVFHMWADGKGSQLWVNNDIDNTISVIDLNKNSVAQTINVGKKPHDVFLTADGSKAYVSVIESDASVSDKVFLYDTSKFTKSAEVSVGKDPHLFHLSTSNRIYVPCQSGELFTLNGNDLTLISKKSFTGAHGVFASPTQSVLFVTNISGNQLYSINPTNGEAVSAAFSTSTPTPHNIVLNEKGDKMFVTHSGSTATNVTIYSVSTTGGGNFNWNGYCG